MLKNLIFVFNLWKRVEFQRVKVGESANSVFYKGKYTNKHHLEAENTTRYFKGITLMFYNLHFPKYDRYDDANVQSNQQTRYSF